MQPQTAAAGKLRVVVQREAAKGVKPACFGVDFVNKNEYFAGNVAEMTSFCLPKRE
jgi:hypothetical protein